LRETPELFCRLFLFEPFEVDEPDQFDLFWFEQDPFLFIIRAAAGLVAP
jgi:hypothetical protein